VLFLGGEKESKETRMSDETLETEDDLGNGGETTDPIDYRRMGVEIERARREAETRRRSAESSAGVVGFGLAIFGTVVGFVTHCWWIGLLAFATPFLSFRVARLQWAFDLCFAGLMSYVTWTLIASHWMTASMLVRVVITVVGGVIGVLVNTALFAMFAGINEDYYRN